MCEIVCSVPPAGKGRCVRMRPVVRREMRRRRALRRWRPMRRGRALRALFSAVLCWGSSLAALSPLSAQDLPQPARREISASELDKLVEISTRLSALNERLRIELEASRRSSSELAALLESSRCELEELRRELESSRRTSSELAARAESSARDLTVLRSALTKAEDSLSSLENSFEAFRRAAEARISRAERGKRLALLAALSGWLSALCCFVFGLVR